MLRMLRTGLAAAVMAAVASQAGAETLEEVYRLALQNDALLKAQAANAAAGREAENIYKSALLPQVSADGGYARSRMDIHGTCTARVTLGRSCDNVDTNNLNGALTVSQNIVNMASWYDFQRGKKITERADAQYRADELELLVRVTEAYVGVLRAIDTYQTALAQEKAIERQLEQTRQRFDVGLIAITDVQESQASYDSARVETLNAKGYIGIAFEAMQVLTGQPLEKIAPLSDQLPIRMPDPADQAAWEKLAMDNNPDLVVSALAVESARANAKARKAGHLPTLTGSYQYSDSNGDIDYPPSIDNVQRGNAVSLNLHVPLYSGGGTSALTRQAYSEQMAAEESHTNNIRNAVQKVRSYHLAVTTDIQRVSAQQQAIVSAQSALDATRAGYEVGTRNIVDVLDAEQRLYRAKLLHANSRYQYILDMLRLLQTAGTLSADNVARLNQWLVADQSYQRSNYR